MKIITILFADEAGINAADGIEHDGKIWLVPEWLDNYPSKRVSTPTRIVRVDHLPMTIFQGYPLLRSSIPKAVLDGEDAKQFEVVTLPDLTVKMESRQLLH